MCIRDSINAGIYVLDMITKTLIEKDEAIDMPDFVDRIKNKYGSVKVFPLHENWIDLGDVDVYTKES